MKIWPFKRRQEPQHAARHNIRPNSDGDMFAHECLPVGPYTGTDDKTLADCRARLNSTRFTTMRPDHLTRFPPGQSGNPRGRRKGIGDDLMEARHIAAAVYRERFGGDTNDRVAMLALKRAGQIMDGHCDDRPEVQSVLAGIKRGRVLGRRGEVKAK